MPRLVFAAPLAPPRRGGAALGENLRSAKQMIAGHPCPLRFSTCCSNQALSSAICLLFTLVDKEFDLC